MVFIWLLLCFFDCSQAISDKNEVINIIPKNYTLLRPLNGNSIPLNWTLYPNIISDLSSMKMEFSVDATFRASWFDEQLLVNAGDNIILTKNIAQQVWYPWIRFENCKGCNPEIVNPEKHTFRIESGAVNVFERHKFTFICMFDLSNYPFDSQICTINIGIRLKNGPISVSFEYEDTLIPKLQKLTPTLVPPEFKLNLFQRVPNPCSSPKANMKAFCFTYIFKFHRIFVQHILLVFLPSMLIVILSWISFWLDVELAAPRVALGLTSLLTLSTQFNSAQRNLPAVATIKALDVWMFMCLFMVFASLLVYAISYNNNRMRKRQVGNVDDSSKCPKSERMSFKRLARINIDKSAKIIFPLFFAAFNICFWLHYL